MTRIFILLILALFLISCFLVSEKPVACTEEAKLCPDGSAVGRIGPDCEFAECPQAPIGCTKELKICSDGSTVGRKLPNCEFEPCPNGKLKAYYCTEEQRESYACLAVYKPVCGWFDSKQVQCIKYPCAQTYSNSCHACLDKKVISWTEGECPA